MSRLETKLIHESGMPADSAGSVVTPICLSTTFVQAAEPSGGGRPEFEYIRTANPTRNRLESCVASLEHAQHCSVFSSGMAAIASIIEGVEFPSTGLRTILASTEIYGGSYRYLEHLRTRYGFRIEYAAFWDSNELAQALKRVENIGLIWLESCTNPSLRVTDLRFLVQHVRSLATKCTIVVDNTFLTPYLLTPLDFGVDAVVHSMTKYLNGHCDVLMGALCTNDTQLWKRVKHFQNAIGNVPSPFDCYLLLRGLKTFALRMQRHCQNAQQLAEFLHQHPAVKHVWYPGLPSHPEHSRCNEMLRNGGALGYGGMVTLIMHRNPRKLLAAVRLFTLAESLGGVESLIEQPETMSHSSIPSEHRSLLGIDECMIRISVGVEHIDDLQEDLERALEQCLNE